MSEPVPVAAEGRLERTVTIVNKRGLHARAAAKFVKLAGEFEDTSIDVTRNGTCVCGVSIMGLMMLAAAPGSEIALSASGPQAAAALDALADLVGRGFDETD
jgi:phosphocarrier protein